MSDNKDGRKQNAVFTIWALYWTVSLHVKVRTCSIPENNSRIKAFVNWADI